MNTLAGTLHSLPAGPGGTGGAAPASETGRMLLATDWSATPLGSMDGWPQSLRIAVSICLNSRFPMFVWWGLSLVNIYNDAYIPILGKRHPRAFGRPAIESWADIWDVLTPQVQAVMQRGEPTWNERVLLVMERNGFTEETWFTWSYSPIQDDTGGIGGLFCACSEETARVLAERERDRLMREAQDAADTLRTWFDNAPGFIALLRGPDFVFEMVNQAYYQLVGHRPIEGMPVFEALPDARDQGFEQLLRGVYDTGCPFAGRGLRVRIQPVANGPTVERFVDLVCQPVHDAAGVVTGIFVQGHDVTDQVRAAEALQEADRRKDEFLATLAHELRNPLAPIRQATQLAQRAGDDAQRRDWALQVIERQVTHMTLLTDDLLDVARISQGKLVLRLEQTELRTIVEAALETARPLLERKQHRLRVELPQAPVRLRADAVRVAQVLSNLLSNAAKYTDAGGCIELTAAVQDGEVAIRVRDNGIGLSAQERAQIFQMFSQVSSALDRAEGGLGIGLALSRGLVELHGGRIEVHSAGAGQGSEFVVHLPGVEAEAPADAAAAADAPAQPRVRRVLIADDNADALETMALLLETLGHEVHTASDGAAALALAEQVQPEVAILDIGMPGLNGYEVAARIRATPWGRPMRLIALTGWGQAQDQARAREAGFDHHCTKPVELEQLQALMAAP